MAAPIARHGSEASAERTRRMVHLYVNEGWRLRDLATHFKCSHVAVYQRLKSQGVEMRPRRRIRLKVAPIIERLAQGATLSQIADDLRRDVSTLSQRLHARGLDVSLVTSSVAGMTALMLDAYCKAIDEDGLPHEDAMEIAMEYREVAA